MTSQGFILQCAVSTTLGQFIRSENYSLGYSYYFNIIAIIECSWNVYKYYYYPMSVYSDAQCTRLSFGVLKIIQN